GALERADAGVGAVGRQVAVAALAVGLEDQHEPMMRRSRWRRKDKGASFRAATARSAVQYWNHGPTRTGRWGLGHESRLAPSSGLKSVFVRVCPWFQIHDEALDFGPRARTEIDQQSNLQTRRAKVVEDLRPMLGRYLSHDLELDDDAIEADEVRGVCLL